MSKAQILVVEDDGIVALGLRMRLQSLGYQISALVPYGEEAVEKAAETRPDLVLMDIKLKGTMDGIEAAHQIRERSDIPVIYLTAYNDDQTLERAKITEPYGYILKPVEERELQATIEMALSKHKMERKLRDHERWLATILKSIGDAVIVTDEVGRITFINHVAETLTGWSEDEALNRNLAEIFTLTHENGYTPPAENSMVRALRTGKVSKLDDQVVLITRDGVKIPVEASRVSIRDEADNRTGTVLVFRDISERKQAEAALQQYMVELQVRNEELDAFAHTVAHDLKNIAGRMSGFAEAMQLHYAAMTDAERKEYLRAVVRNGRKMANLIDELLLLAGVRQQEVKLKPLDMNTIISEARQRLAHLIEEYQAEIILPATWPTVLGYGPWIEEVWVNYLSNGIKYGGRPPRLEVGATRQPDNMVRFWVRDNGPGLTAAEQAHLFTPFTHLSQISTEGHGLGLSIVRRIVEKLGGQVDVESEGVPGQGSLFGFTLPTAIHQSEKSITPKLP